MRKPEKEKQRQSAMKPQVDLDDMIEDDASETPQEGDLTQEDLDALGPVDLSMDMGDDEDLKHREFPVDFSGKDLDIPGSELDDEEEEIGEEDEENNSYSLGGDRHD